MFELTVAQSQVYFDQALNPDSAKYNVGGYVVFREGCDVNKIKRSIEISFAVNRTLSLGFKKIGEKVFQYDMEYPFELGFVDFSSGGGEEALDWIRSRFDLPMDLFGGCLYETFLIKKDDKTYIWYMRAHHMIVDGYSYAVLCRQVIENVERKELDENIGNDSVNYFEAVKDSLCYLSSTSYAKDKKYWSDRLSSFSSSFDVGKDYGCSNVVSFEVGGEFAKDISELRLVKRYGLQSTVLGILTALCCRIFSREELCVGLGVHGRTKKYYKTVGMFSKVIPVLLPGSVASIDSYIELVKSQISKDNRHYKYPLKDIFNGRLIAGARGSFGLLDIGFSYDNFDFSDLKLVSDFVHVLPSCANSLIEVRLRDFFSGSKLEFLISSPVDVFSVDELQKISNFLGVCFSRLNRNEDDFDIERAFDIVSDMKLDSGSKKEDDAENILIEIDFEDEVLEKTIKNIWSEVLSGREKLSYDNFFVDGGDSLKAMSFIARLNDELGVRVLLPDFYFDPSLKHIVNLSAISREGNGFKVVL